MMTEPVLHDDRARTASNSAMICIGGGSVLGELVFPGTGILIEGVIGILLALIIPAKRMDLADTRVFSHVRKMSRFTGHAYAAFLYARYRRELEFDELTASIMSSNWNQHIDELNH